MIAGAHTVESRISDSRTESSVLFLLLVKYGMKLAFAQQRATYLFHQFPVAVVDKHHELAALVLVTSKSKSHILLYQVSHYTHTSNIQTANQPYIHTTVHVTDCLTSQWCDHKVVLFQQPAEIGAKNNHRTYYRRYIKETALFHNTLFGDCSSSSSSICHLWICMSLMDGSASSSKSMRGISNAMPPRFASESVPNTRSISEYLIPQSISDPTVDPVWWPGRNPITCRQASTQALVQLRFWSMK